jgi:hypothetical protein
LKSFLKNLRNRGKVLLTKGLLPTRLKKTEKDWKRLKKTEKDEVEFFKTAFGNWKILENRGKGFVAESAFTYKTEKVIRRRSGIFQNCVRKLENLRKSGKGVCGQKRFYL